MIIPECGVINKKGERGEIMRKLLISSIIILVLTSSLFGASGDKLSEVFWGKRFASDLRAHRPSPSVILRENPVGNYLKLKFSIPIYGGATIKIYDVHGSLVMDRKVEVVAGNIYFNVSRLKSGVYLFKVTAGPFTRTGVFLKR